jgi:hypothetical protein
VTISVLGSKNSTVARAVVTKPTKDWSGQEYVFEAAESSKREQGDVFDPVTGELLALARVFQRLSRQLFSEGSKRVKVSTEAQEAALIEAGRKKHAAVTPVKRRGGRTVDCCRRKRSPRRSRGRGHGGILPGSTELAQEARRYRARESPDRRRHRSRSS